MQALSPTHSPYSATNARNQIRNQAALESRGSGRASFLDHILSRVDTVLLSPALLPTILSFNNSNKQDISIIADSSLESVVRFRFIGVRILSKTSHYLF